MYQADDQRSEFHTSLQYYVQRHALFPSHWQISHSYYWSAPLTSSPHLLSSYSYRNVFTWSSQIIHPLFPPIIYSSYTPTSLLFSQLLQSYSLTTVKHGPNTSPHTTQFLHLINNQFLLFITLISTNESKSTRGVGAQFSILFFSHY